MKILKEAFGPMPSTKTVVARLRLLVYVVVGWIILLHIIVAIDIFWKGP